MLEALSGRVSGFRRTPKYNLQRGESLAGRRYRGTINHDTWIELGLGIYFVLSTGLVIAAGLWGAVPFLALFVVGYCYTAASTLLQCAIADRAPFSFAAIRGR